MKKVLKFTLMALIVPALLFSSCKKETTTEQERQTDPEFQALTAYMTSNNLDLDDVLADWITTASAIKDDLATYNIIDIRAADAYNSAHVPGAVNSTLGGILTTADGLDDKPIIVVCYSGQSAGHAVCALRLSGYADAKVLKWGMSGWGPTWDSWTNSCDQQDSPNWVAAPGSIVTNKEFDDPSLTGNAADAAALLADRVDVMLAKGFQGIASTDVLGSPGTYYINNYWASTDVETYGNIVNAYRVQPLTIAGDQFKYIDPSKTDVTYCWTGQTSSMITAYLTVLGFEAKSLKNGANSMIYDDLMGHKWSTPAEDLPVEP